MPKGYLIERTWIARIAARRQAKMSALVAPEEEKGAQHQAER